MEKTHRIGCGCVMATYREAVVQFCDKHAAEHKATRDRWNQELQWEADIRDQQEAA